LKFDDYKNLERLLITHDGHKMSAIVNAIDPTTNSPFLSLKVHEWPIAHNVLTFGNHTQKFFPNFDNVPYNTDSILSTVFSVGMLLLSGGLQAVNGAVAEILWRLTYNPQTQQGAVGIKHTLRGKVQYAPVEQQSLNVQQFFISNNQTDTTTPLPPHSQNLQGIFNNSRSSINSSVNSNTQLSIKPEQRRSPNPSFG
jgi:hypothetical protein